MEVQDNLRSFIQNPNTMKTLILSMLLAFASFTINRAIATDLDKDRYMSTVEIVVRDITYPKPPQPEPRSAIPTVFASYSSDISLLELNFTKPLGIVTIYIVNDMGQCVAKYNCNTQNESDVYINVVVEEGSYTIRIIGNEYEAEGYFTL